ncbi:MAG: hypothetical protein R2880_10465 [Deinococcales bacterium]
MKLGRFKSRSLALARGDLPWWAYLHVLSLDAPLVALCWQWALAHGFAVKLSSISQWLLGLVVWLIYVADRLYDGLQIRQALTLRHRFYQNYAMWFIGLWLAIFVLACALLPYLSPAELGGGIALAVLCIFYLWQVHRAKPFLKLAKEWQVGLMFSLGSGLSLWLHQQGVLVYLSLVCFALLCSSNCILISLWEAQEDLKQGQLAWPQHHPKNYPYGHALPYIGLLSCLSLIQKPFLALSLSLANLALILLDSSKLDKSLKRVLVDMVLLTPWLLFILGLFF